MDLEFGRNSYVIGFKTNKRSKVKLNVVTTPGSHVSLGPDVKWWRELTSLIKSLVALLIWAYLGNRSYDKLQNIGLASCILICL